MRKQDRDEAISTLAVINVLGRLADDAQFVPASHTAGGEEAVPARCTFHVIVNAGRNKKHRNAYRCTIWGNRAEKLHQYLKKGKQVEVTGSPDLYTLGEVPQEDGSTKTAKGINIRVNPYGLVLDAVM